MARIFTRYFRKAATAKDHLASARAAELRGELPQAAVLFAQAGKLDEAARVMVLRGDAETDLGARLRHYVQAATTAPPNSNIGQHARRKRWTAVLLMSSAGPLTPALRDDLARAAAELEAIGEDARAAEAYALLGDVDSRARALARAGDVEALEALLATELRRDREANALKAAHAEFDLYVASGQRRQALALAHAFTDESLRERARSVESRRVRGPVVNLTLRGKDTLVVPGEEVVIGRAPDWESLGQQTGAITVASPALSRRHLVVARADGEPIVRDLGSPNRTILRGLALSGDVPVGPQIELRLGGEVPLVVRRSRDFRGAVEIEVAGGRFIAPLGPAMLGVGRWRLERAPDGWVELWTEDQPPAFAGSLRITERVELLIGDAIGSERGGEPLLEMKGT
jgi:hypothetical protein